MGGARDEPYARGSTLRICDQGGPGNHGEEVIAGESRGQRLWASWANGAQGHLERETMLRCGFCGDAWSGERCEECGSDFYFEVRAENDPILPTARNEEPRLFVEYLPVSAQT